MSKHDYSTYNPECHDKVFVQGEKCKVCDTQYQGTVCKQVGVTGSDGDYFCTTDISLVKPRGKTKREFLKATKQGKWAEVFEAGDWVTQKSGIRTDQITKIAGDNVYCGENQNLYRFKRHIRHATPEEIEAATKPVDAWEGAEYGIRTAVQTNGNYWREKGYVFAIRSIEDRYIFDTNNRVHEKYNCKPIIPAKMTREQAISILEGLD